MLPTATPDRTSFNDYVQDYDAACECGLRFAGESRDYFARKRVEQTAARVNNLPAGAVVLDFGCGPGHAAPLLLDAFPRAALLGVDNAAEMIASAHQSFGSKRARFECTSLDP